MEGLIIQLSIVPVKHRRSLRNGADVVLHIIYNG